MRRSLRLAFAICLAMARTSISGAQSAHPSPEKPTRRLANTYGTTAESYYRVTAAEFTPLSMPATYSDQFYQNPGSIFLGRFATSAGEDFVATPHLPSGAVLTYLELDNCDTSDDANVSLSLLDCDYGGFCGFTAARSLSSLNNVTPHACSYASADISALGLTVNNYGRQLSLLVTTQSLDANTSFSGVIIGYRLQVAPSPATATFDDVPTTHPYFQFIEALSSWGITSGCSTNPPDYCPERPITRGEMAIYMAKALGLYLPQY